jgi:predicted Rossmann fold nucleotide-binding protein DprA/Smf involved in DNA uptake
VAVPGAAAMASILLTDRSLASSVPPLKASEYWPLVRAVGDEGLAAGDAHALASTGLDHDRIETLLARATAMAFELDRLQQSGISVLSGVDPAYPMRLRQRLGIGAPPLLYVAGPISLLAREAIAVVGWRSVDAAGGEVVRSVVDAAAARGLGVVSGGARGVDRLAMAAAVEAGTTSVAVLPEGLDRALRSADDRRAVLGGHTLLCSPYPARAATSETNAVGRNRIVYGLARVAFVVATDEGTDGTGAGATDAVEQGRAPVAVWTGAGAAPGNAALVEVGATPITDVEDLFAIDPGFPAAPA